MKILDIKNKFKILAFVSLCAFFTLTLSSNNLMASDNDLVVVEARGVSLTPGQMIDGSKPLVLKDGQTVSLLAVSGLMIKLKGPFDKAPISDQPTAAADVLSAIQSVATQKAAKLDRAGVVRGAAPEQTPPEPFVLDISHPGKRCVVNADQLVLWRSEKSEATTVTVQPSDRSWKIKEAWPADQDRLPLTVKNLSSKKQTDLVVKLDKEVRITVLTLPDVLKNPAMQAAWMSEEGCDHQAIALLNSLGKQVSSAQ